MRKIKKILLITVPLLVLIVLVIVSRSCNSGQAVVYEYGKVTRGEVMKTIAVRGNLELYDEYTVSSLVSGEIRGLYADFNQSVRKGQKLAYIESMTTDQKVLSYGPTFKKAKYELESQQEFLSSKKALLSENLISQKEYENALRSYQLSLSSYEQAKALYDGYLEEQRSKTVVAPVDGIVIQVWAKMREPVNIGKPLFLIASTMKKMKLIINVDESDIGFVGKGQQVEFFVNAYASRPFYGVIEQVRMHPKVVNTNVMYEALVICENPDASLRPGMTASATVKVDQKKGVLRVPSGALIVSPAKAEPRQGMKIVWVRRKVVTNDLPVRKVEVKAGVEGDTFTEIVSGPIKEGEEVLTGFYRREVE
jgi:HlyD family secretion protein